MREYFWPKRKEYPDAGPFGPKKSEPLHISKLLWGLSNKNLPYLMLKDLVMKSGFFIFTTATVMMVGRWCHWF